ncbi:21722_t:CDS:1, partial [Cetraspora pellucida]
MSKIADCYTDKIKNAFIVINSYLQRGEFIIFDLIKPEDNFLAICL